MSRAPFVGVGPGRCGTKTLQMIVDACDNTSVTHERYLSPWYHNDAVMTRLEETMKKNREVGILVGEVQCQLLSHVPFLRHHIPDLKVVCLHRPKDEVVRSYLGGKNFIFKPMFRPMDKFNNYPEGDEWPGRYPIIDAATSEQAYGFWWEMCEELMRGVSDPVLHFGIEEFNTDDGINRLFDFLEIPETDRVYLRERRHNSSESRDEMTLEEHMVEAGLVGES